MSEITDETLTCYSPHPLMFVHKETNKAICEKCARGMNIDELKKDFVYDVYYEGVTIDCSSCGTEIESAYGEPEDPINICPKCGADLFEVGVTEAIAGGYTETEIHFENGETKIGVANIQDFDEQWALCGRCGKPIEYTAADIIEAFEHLHPPKAPEGGDR